ncbi:MAG: mannose-1-phosphate guanylyltransferase [Deltaproteobacteria bacterium]|nr:mannose-1-phosphate guanylyltransferase [Deltaproteobacteria bacterium]
MAGGSGTRFWPASRAHRPKQLLPLGGGTESLLAATVARIAPIVPTERTLVVTAAVLADATRRELPSLPAENLLAEPSPRNTAPCIGWATRTILARDPEAIIAVLPSDQHVDDPAGLRASMQSALEVAKVRALATIGIRPTRPDTGFGYIETGGFVPEVDGAHEVSRFVEKPDAARAREYLASGRFLWNSGMFFFRARAMDEAIRAHLPELARGLDAMIGDAAVREVFPALPSISIDYGVVERVGATPGQVGVVPGDFGWSDVGSWESAWELAAKDDAGNALPEGAIAVDARRNLVRLEGSARGKQVALVGVEDLVVVETDDALLVLPRGRAQDVRAVVEALKAKGRNDLL